MGWVILGVGHLGGGSSWGWVILGVGHLGVGGGGLQLRRGGRWRGYPEKSPVGSWRRKGCKKNHSLSPSV